MTGRDGTFQVRRLKQTHTSHLRAAHVSSKQLAPERSELAQLRAEIAVLQQQLGQAEALELASADAGSLTADFEGLQSALDSARLRRHELHDQIRQARHEGRRRRETHEGQRLAQMQAQLEPLRPRRITATSPLRHRCTAAAPPLHRRCTAAAPPLHPRLHPRYIPVTSPLHRRYIAVTSSLHHRYIPDASPMQAELERTHEETAQLQS